MARRWRLIVQAIALGVLSACGPGYVDEKEPAPGQFVGQQAADKRTDRRAHRADAGPEADGDMTLVAGKGVRGDGERIAEQKASRRALKRATNDEPHGGWRETAQD